MTRQRHLLLFLLLAFVSRSKSTNWIVEENLKAGSPSQEWDVNGAGCPAVRGFATRASLFPLEDLTLKVKIDGGEALSHIDVYRMGYYQGNGARRVARIAISDEATSVAASQPDCLRNNTYFDCGNWNSVFTWTIPEGAVSGLYFARMTLKSQKGGWRADASARTHDPSHAVPGRDPLIPPSDEYPHAYGASGHNKLDASFALTSPRASLAFFVVLAPPSSSHDLLFQTADATWHAYNGYGGYTTYGTFRFPYLHEPFSSSSEDPSSPDAGTKRAHIRSYNTPLITRDYRSVNAPFGPELAAITFLERNGYDLHYATGMDMSGPGAAGLLERSRAYVDAGHDEYFTYEQRAALETARSAGTHLNFWTGNEAYWAVRFEGRDMVCYKETQSDVKLDKEGEWTGTFRDARPMNPKGPRPENALTGTLFAANAQRVDPILLDGQTYGGHRAWRGTSLEAGWSGYVKPGVLGHEWDQAVDNGHSPPHLQRISSTRVENIQVIQDHGSTFDTGAATHTLVLFKGEGGGGWTFGAGTVQWSWALSELHDVNDPQRANKYDIRVERDLMGGVRDLKQLTVNIFEDQGVLPGSLEPELTLSGAGLVAGPHPGVDLESFKVENGQVAGKGAAWVRAGDGVVASVEVSWVKGRWHIADVVGSLEGEVEWKVSWGGESWHAKHGNVPDGKVDRIWIRAADDSGNGGAWEFRREGREWKGVEVKEEL